MSPPRLLRSTWRALGPAAATLVLAATSVHARPNRWRAQWLATDFTRTTVVFVEIRSGGGPKDGIPAIWAPEFRRVTTEHRPDDPEPLMPLEIGDDARVHPGCYLMWHENVNDVVGGVPMAVTLCPLCNSAMAFEARVDGARRSFGIPRKLRHSDMLMYDRETESWRQRATGEGIVGRHTGARLQPLPSWMESWVEVRVRNPDKLVPDEPDWRCAYARTSMWSMAPPRGPSSMTARTRRTGFPRWSGCSGCRTAP